MMREATCEDAADIEAFLAETPETTMFLRSNLVHGVGRGAHRHATRYFLWVERAGIAGVFGLTGEGFLLAQVRPGFTACYPAFATAIAGETVKGMTGASTSVTSTLEALGLANAAYALNHDEPLMRAELANWPDCADRLVAVRSKDEVLLNDWFAAYERDTGMTENAAEARERGAARAKAALAPDAAVRVLTDETGTPVAMAAINARLPDVVQVGGVFVPSELRGQGLGRRVTAALLAEARQDGARTAILFANNAAAERAYRAIGFEPVGHYRVAILRESQTVGALV